MIAVCLYATFSSLAAIVRPLHIGHLARFAVAALALAALTDAGAAASAPVDKPVPKAAARSASGSVGAAAGALTTAGHAPAAQATAAAAPVAAEADADPMERLRLRLAERLAKPGAAPVSGTLDLQVGTRALSPAVARPAGVGAKPADGHGHGGAAPSAQAAAATAAPAPARASSHRVVAHASAATAVAPSAHAMAPAAAGRRTAAQANAAHGTVPHWGYEGTAGPAAWGGMKPEFNLCASGQRQSPIDIRGGLAVELDAVKFDYKPTAFGVIDNGHTVQVNMQPGNAIEVGGRRYELVQFHFHRPSEERIDGRQFEMSLHLVHKDSSGRLAVVGVLLGKGPAHPAVQTVWNNLPLERNEEAPARSQLDPAHLLPDDRRYYTYMGSLTTPPCSEGVLWVVMRTPVTVTAEQVELFARIYPMNARPAQPVAGRRIMQSQ
jgi:carbonic anhydrase